MKPNPLEMLKVYSLEQKALSLEEIFDDLTQISKIKKCALCGCTASTLREFEDLATARNKPALAQKARVLREANSKNKRYECINCAPCYAADISNLLFQMSARPAAGEPRSSSCGCVTECAETEAGRWPVEKGDYLVGNHTSTVAVCTLANTELPQRIHSKLADKIAMVGYCETENIGIEKVVKNIISNSSIRHLLLCGNDSGSERMGHFAGQAILSLHANGVSEQGRIIGAKGRRPVLKNLDSQQIRRFQAQVEIVNLIGTHSVKEIGAAAHACVAKNRPKFDGKWVNLPSQRFIVAQKPRRLVLDKKGFFVILPQKAENQIYVEYYANSGKLMQTVVGRDAASIYSTIIEKGFVSQLDHAAYLGKELARAEYFLKYGIPYHQDGAL